jgi:ankyrin repeat protein
METNRSHTSMDRNNNDELIEINIDEPMTNNDDDDPIMSAMMSINNDDTNVLKSVRPNDETQEQHQPPPVIEQRMREDVNHQFCNLWRTMEVPNWSIQVFMENVTALLDQNNADLNTRGEFGRTLLACICRYEHYHLS